VGMFDTYVPVPPLRRPVCGAELRWLRGEER
jgi:hypothetical protein